MKSVIKIILLSSVFVFYSCSNANKGNVTCEDFDVVPNIKECITERKIPNEARLGEVIEYEGKDKMQKNMLSQFKSYNSALIRGDFDNACHYQYADAVKYFRKFYPGESDHAIMRNFFSSVSEGVVQTIKHYEDHGIKINIIVSRIIRKITQGDNIIYVFEIVSNLVGDNLQIHTNPEKSLAISTNSGKNWTFNTINEDTPNILRLRYSEEVINKVMGY